MKQLIFKELREQFRVALLGLAVFTVILGVGFENCRHAILQAALSHMYGESANFHPLLSKSIQTQVAFFCGIFGTLLGWLQIRAEKHPDLWAFLVHRPVTKTTILRGKVVAGVLLYGLGAGVPLLALVLVASIPGTVATPFAWAMALPFAALFFAGIICYFAGLLVGLRKARWFASRGIALVLAVMVTASSLEAPEFWQAMVPLVIAGVVFALAVWGAFQTGGHYQAQPMLGKLALTAINFFSIATILIALFSLTTNFLFPRHYISSSYQLLKDGSIVKIAYHETDGPDLDEADIVDLKGQPLLDQTTGQKLKNKELQRRFSYGARVTVNFENNQRDTRRYGEGYSYAGRFFDSWRVTRNTIWYLTHDGRLVAYDAVTRRLAASLGPIGSHEDGSPDDSRFLLRDDYYWNNLQDYTEPEVLASARTAYLADLEKRELTPLLTVPDGDAIGGYGYSEIISKHVLIATRTSIKLLSIQGGTLWSIPYEPSYPAYSSLTVHQLEPGNTFAVLFTPDYVLNEKSGGKLLERVIWINSDGTIRNSMDLPTLDQAQNQPVSEKFGPFFGPTFLPLPRWDESNRIWSLMRVVSAILCASVGWKLGRRHNFAAKAKIGWGIFHLLFGIPGLLAFLAVQEWPAKETCPRCGKLRAINREQCEHCGAAFPPPEKSGTEIFAPLANG